MGNKPSNTGGGGPALDAASRRQTAKGKRSTLGTKHTVAPPLGPKNYVDMGFPEDDPATGRPYCRGEVRRWDFDGLA